MYAILTRSDFLISQVYFVGWLGETQAWSLDHLNTFPIEASTFSHTFLTLNPPFQGYLGEYEWGNIFDYLPNPNIVSRTPNHFSSPTIRYV